MINVLSEISNMVAGRPAVRSERDDLRCHGPVGSYLRCPKSLAGRQGRRQVGSAACYGPNRPMMVRDPQVVGPAATRASGGHGSCPNEIESSRTGFDRFDDRREESVVHALPVERPRSLNDHEAQRGTGPDDDPAGPERRERIRRE